MRITVSLRVDGVIVNRTSYQLLLLPWERYKEFGKRLKHLLKLKDMVPWSSGNRDWLVKSTTGDQPHLVKPYQKQSQQYCCDDKYPMFKGFSICAHTVATAEANGDLGSFITWYVANKCRPNLTSIALQGMPTGAGRKGGVAKRKRTSRVAVETWSSRFSTTVPDPKRVSLTQGNTTSGAYVSSPLQPAINYPTVTLPTTVSPAPLHASTSTATGQLSNVVRNQGIASSSSLISLQPSTTMCHVVTAPSQLTTVSTSGHCITSVPYSAQQLSPVVTTPVAKQVANILQQILMNAGNTLGQQAGTSPAISSVNQSASQPANPFILKFKTNQIRVCQSCRQNFSNDLQLVVAQAERHLVQNMATGTNFLGRESNSHYHLQLSCLRLACPSFSGPQLIIPGEVKAKLTDGHIRFIEQELSIKI
ncbi:uncharacterized protein [Dysidea avara]|uniref:uncharacterized protein n=1 Tax=Dysidea avara TaxID=196820 RepID=UPI003326D87B